MRAPRSSTRSITPRRPGSCCTTSASRTTAGFGLVVHPPLGKQLIAVGEVMFSYTGLGWRLMAAVFGVALAVLVTRIVRRISRSTLVGAMAGLLVVADGVSFVASRTALLDIFMTVFVVAAFGALMVDRDQVRMRLQNAWLEDRIDETPGAQGLVCGGGGSVPECWWACPARRNGRACTT